MPDQFSPSFEHEALEADIKALALEVAKHGERPENKNLSGEALLKEAIRSLPAISANTQPDAAQKQVPPRNPLPAYAQNAPAEVKLEIEYLLDLAFHHGIAKADTEARRSPAFVLDAFHDALAGRLYPEFQRRGLLK